MHMKMCIHYSLLRRVHMASYKVCLCFIVLYDFVLYHMVVDFVGIKFLDFIKFLIHDNL